MAIGLAGIMVLIFAGIVTWWVSESVHAPGVLLNGIGNGLPFTSRVVPPTLLIVRAPDGHRAWCWPSAAPARIVRAVGPRRGDA